MQYMFQKAKTLIIKSILRIFETDLDENVPGKYTGTYSYESSKTGLKGKTTIYIIVE